MTGGVGCGAEGVGETAGAVGAGVDEADGGAIATRLGDGPVDGPEPPRRSVGPRPAAVIQPAPRRPAPPATARTTAVRRDAVGRRTERRGVLARLGVTGRAMWVRRYRLMIRSLRFLGVRTDAFDATVALYRDAFGLEPVHERAGAAWFKAADGASIHVYDASDVDHDFFDAGPVVGFEVQDFDAARGALVAAGVAFIGEPQRDGGVAWNHYRGPDGNVYEIIGPDRSGG
jgi:catechol 2,3-dioxygenase-like lactoylglutathione lyase family enzyme